MSDASGYRFAINKLNSENYAVWSWKMELLLIKDKLWDVILEEKPTEATKVAAWKSKDDQARATIGLLVEDNQLLHIRNAKSAKEAWDALKGYHQKSTLTSKVHLLKRVCRTVLREDGDMEQHIASISNSLNQLSALGQDLPDNLQAAILLASLPESYDTLVTALESRPEEDITSQLVKSKLIDEYKRRKSAKDARDDAYGDSALKTDFRKGNDNSNKKQQKKCYFCKNGGHFKTDCTKYKAWLQKNPNKANKVIDNNTRDNVNEVLFAVTQHTAEACFAVKEKASWCVDSGATSHMSSNREFFERFDSKRKGHVRFADEETLAEVCGSGTGTIKCGLGGKITAIKLQDVLYVPSLGSNLLSVKKLAADGYSCVFEGKDCRIFKNKELQAVAALSSDLYKVINVEKVCVSKETDVDSSDGDLAKGKNCSNCQHVWHRRFGHRDATAIKDLEKKGLASGIAIRDCMRREQCECCIKGKMTRKPFPKESSTQSQAVLDLVHTDVCGPMQTMSLGQKRYILTIIDDYSRFTKVYFLKHKNEVTAIIKEYVELSKTQFGKKPKVIRSDRGREYVNGSLCAYLKGEGIRIQYTAAYSPQQNGVAERKNRYLVEMARCMLIDAGLENKYWAEAINTANYLQNRLPTKATNKTPFELWFSRKPDVANLHIFGCDAYVYIHKEQRQKLDNKAEKLIFVGYSDESKAYRLLDLKTNKIKTSRDVIFLEKGLYKNEASSHTKVDEVTLQFDKIPTNEHEEDDSDTSASSSNESSIEEESGNDSSNDDEPPRETSGIESRYSMRSNRGVPPDRYAATLRLAKTDKVEPQNIQEALSGPDKVHWEKAMTEEIDSLIKNCTWEIVPKPKDRAIVTNKWVYKIKRNANGDIERYKARLVARGFSQKYGTDYDEVFAPVVRQTTFRTLLTIAGLKNISVKHLDAKTAFLNGRLEETIFMKQPDGFEIPGKEDHVCKLHKGIYGLKQAAKVWNDQLNSLLQSYGFVQSKIDPCLYTNGSGVNKIYLIVYVDDFLIAAKDNNEVNSVINFLRQHFQLTDLGNISRYLGMEIKKNSEGFYCIKQAQYIDKILQRFNLQDAKISAIPLDSGYVKHRMNESTNDSMKNSEKYQQLIGALLYVAVNTRPDIAASVTILSQHNKQPTETDWNEVKRIARYLKGTRDYELVLGQRGVPETLVGFTDADWAEDTKNRKSNSGYLFQYSGASISWGCRKQTCVALSSTEAEYVALAEGCQEALWLQRLLKDFLGVSQGTVTIHEDNQSCLKLIYNKKFSNRTKHIDTKYHFVKDLQEQKIVQFKYCPTDEMPADMLTKPLNRIKLKYMVEKCGLHE